jgi:hypothetical protein
MSPGRGSDPGWPAECTCLPLEPSSHHAKSRLTLESLWGHSGQRPRAKRQPAWTGRGPSPARYGRSRYSSRVPQQPPTVTGPGSARRAWRLTVTHSGKIARNLHDAHRGPLRWAGADCGPGGASLLPDRMAGVLSPPGPGACGPGSQRPAMGVWPGPLPRTRLLPYLVTDGFCQARLRVYMSQALLAGWLSHGYTRA